MARKWAVLAGLLFLPITLVEAHNRVIVEAGHEAVLSCPNVSKMPLLLVTWKRDCNRCCLLSYRSDHNEMSKLNCSERITWKYLPASDPALRIYPVNLGDEGNYTCVTANSEGNFHFLFSLTVIVPPTVTLTHDKSRVAVCQASAGKPAADISWIPASNHSSEEEFHHPNGTVTRVSYFNWANSSFPSVTCLVTHPTTNQTLLMDLTHTSHSLLYILIGAAAGVAAVTGVTSYLIFRCRESQELKAARGEPQIYQLCNPAPSNHSNFLTSYFQLAGYVKGHVAQQNTLQLKPSGSHPHVREEKQTSLVTFQSTSMRITAEDLFMYAYNSVCTSSQLSY